MIQEHGKRLKRPTLIQQRKKGVRVGI
jgi:hypothetical protein